MEYFWDICVNSFVKRQTADSRFTHIEYNGNDEWGCIKDLVKDNLVDAKSGYREGVVLVPVPCEGEYHQFFSGVCLLENGDRLCGEFSSRRDGEYPRKQVSVENHARSGGKLPAKSVDIVLYASSVLAEDGSNELKPEHGNWEIISVNGNPFDGEMPIAPMTLMHNHFGSDGGTDTNLTDGEFVEMLRQSFEFWKDKAMIG